MKELNILTGIVAVILFAIVFAGYSHIMVPDNEAIQKCIDATNYSKERCQWELTR